MKRDYKKRPLFDRKRMGLGLFTLFIIFVAYKIQTPPSIELARRGSPDGQRTARLRKIYYVSQPSYKVDFRDDGKLIWLNLLYLSSYTNVPHATADETLEWGPNSETLTFKINGTAIWHYAFHE